MICSFFFYSFLLLLSSGGVYSVEGFLHGVRSPSLGDGLKLTTKGGVLEIFWAGFSYCCTYPTLLASNLAHRCSRSIALVFVYNRAL